MNFNSEPPYTPKPEPTALLTMFPANVTVWKSVFLAARIMALLSDEQLMGDMPSQMYIRGMCEGYGILVANNEQMPSTGDGICTRVQIGGEMVELDQFGASAALSLVQAIENAAGMSVFDVMQEQVRDNHCQLDLVEYLNSLADKKVEAETDNLDARLIAFLDDNT